MSFSCLLLKINFSGRWLSSYVCRVNRCHNFAVVIVAPSTGRQDNSQAQRPRTSTVYTGYAYFCLYEGISDILKKKGKYEAIRLTRGTPQQREGVPGRWPSQDPRIRVHSGHCGRCKSLLLSRTGVALQETTIRCRRLSVRLGSCDC